MIPIIQTETDQNKLYLAYIPSGARKTVIILKVDKESVKVLYRWSSQHNIFNNKSVVSRNTSGTPIVGVDGKGTFFPDPHVDSTCLFELTSDEINLLLAQQI